MRRPIRRFLYRVLDALPARIAIGLIVIVGLVVGDAWDRRTR